MSFKDAWLKDRLGNYRLGYWDLKTSSYSKFSRQDGKITKIDEGFQADLLYQDEEVYRWFFSFKENEDFPWETEAFWDKVEEVIRIRQVVISRYIQVSSKNPD